MSFLNSFGFLQKNVRKGEIPSLVFVQLTSDFLDLSLIFEAFVIDAVRLNPPGSGSALEYPELMSSVDLT